MTDALTKLIAENKIFVTHSDVHIRLAQVTEVEHGAIESALLGDIPLLLKAIEAKDHYEQIKLRI